MAVLPEEEQYPAGILQLEQEHPVLGGPPNEATLAGIDNIPHQQLAKRTNWLKARVDMLVGKVIAASTTVAGIVRLSSATNSDNETMAATPAAIKAAMENANGRVPAAPLAVTDLDDLAGLGRFGAAGEGAAHGPAFDYPAVINAVQSSGRNAQLAMVTSADMARLAVRSQAGAVFSPWAEAWLGDPVMASLGTNGMHSFPSGMMIQWGTSPATDSEGRSRVTFPQAFAASPYAAIAIDRSNSESPLSARSTCAIATNLLSATQMTVLMSRYDGTPSTSDNCFWFAIGGA